MPRQLRFGLWYDFRNPPRWRRDPAELYRGIVAQIARAEQLGWDDVWLSEHHFIDDGYTPSMLPLACAIASATTRMQIGTSVLLLPLHDPLRVAEDAATVDVMSGGRFQLGVAAGYRKGEFTEFFADMQEWQIFAEAVSEAAAKLTPEERAAACAFGQNYGEAGAVEYFGPELGLPPVLSGHNSWHLWGPQGCTAATTFLVIDRDRDDLDELFESVEAGAVFDCRDCMPYEDGLTVWIARGARVGIAELWPRLRHFS